MAIVKLQHKSLSFQLKQEKEYTLQNTKSFSNKISKKQQ